MSVLWWEKTVEYLFVKKYVDLDKVIAPLDGKHETVGDAIFLDCDKWVLIEFKRDINTISSEIRKYENYIGIKTELENKDSHHLIIYGEKESNELILNCQTYFSEKNFEISEALKKNGVQSEVFKEYLSKIIESRSESSDSEGYALVAGVSHDGRVAKCLTLYEYSKLNLNAELTKKLEKKIDRGYSSPSLGR